MIRPGHEVYKIGLDHRAPSAASTTRRRRLKVVCVQETTAILEITESCEPVLSSATCSFRSSRSRSLSCARARRSPSATRRRGRPPATSSRSRTARHPSGPTRSSSSTSARRTASIPGDFLTVFRARNDSGTIRTLLGEVAVLWTKGRTCVAKVTSMVDYMGVGDFVELK